MKRFVQTIAVAAVLMILGIGNATGQELVGAGATFPYPLYSKMFAVYGKENAVKVNYQAIGSAAAFVS